MFHRSMRTTILTLVAVWSLSSAETRRVHGADAPRQAPDGCVDSKGAVYGAGFVLSIDGRRMKCVGPHWAAVGGAPGSPNVAVLDVGDTNLNAGQEALILKQLNAGALPPLQCDAVLNSRGAAADLTRVPVGERRLMMFWTPACEPCKPLLAQLAALAAENPKGLSVVSVVRSALPDLEPEGDWGMDRVKRLVAEYKVSFPTCVHSSKRVTSEWHAEGVPITYLLSEKGVERVASGGTNGLALVAELAAAAKTAKR